MAKSYGGFCLPVVIYLVLAIIGITLNFLRPPFILSNKLISTGIQVLFAGLWAWLLIWACKINENVSWLILLGPFLLGLIFVFILPIAVDLIRGRPLDVQGRFQDTVGTAENAVQRIMQQPTGGQMAASDKLQGDLQDFQYGGSLNLSTAKTIAQGAATAGGFNAQPNFGFRPY